MESQKVVTKFETERTTLNPLISFHLNFFSDGLGRNKIVELGFNSI